MAKQFKIENQYKGKTPKQVWNAWDKDQRWHFMSDHGIVKKLRREGKEQWQIVHNQNSDYDFLAMSIREEVDYHVGHGQYESGGKPSEGIGAMVDTSKYQLYIGSGSDSNNIDSLKKIADNLRENGFDAIVTELKGEYRIYYKGKISLSEVPKKRVYREGGVSSSEQKAIEDQIEQIRKSVKSKATSLASRTNMEAILPKLEAKLEGLKQQKQLAIETAKKGARIKERKHKMALRQAKAKKELPTPPKIVPVPIIPKEEPVKEVKPKLKHKTPVYIDIDMASISEKTFRKKLWAEKTNKKSLLKGYSTKEFESTLRITVDNKKSLDKVYDIYAGLLNRKKLNVPKIEEISGVFKQGGNVKAKTKSMSKKDAESFATKLK